MSKPSEQTDAAPSSEATQDVDDVRIVGIIGAGVMGEAIGLATARSGRQVIMLDHDLERSETAARNIVRELQSAALQLQDSVTSAACKSSENVPAVSVAATCRDLRECDLVIEAIVEKLETKHALYAELQPHVRPDTVVASNSSSLPIAHLASAWKDASRFCGLHFCHPVDQRPLVEVIGAEETASSTVEAAYRFAEAIGMSPIRVKDNPGFLLNRLLVPYMNESLELVLEGATVEQLEQSALAFGLPFGPIEHYDEFGIDVALAVGRSLFWKYRDRIVPSELLIAMYKSKRLGRKSGDGFYSDDEHGRRRVDPAVMEMIEYRRRDSRTFSDEEITHRLFLPMLLEAKRALDNSLVESEQVIDDALRDGLGLTDRYEGLFRWANRIGNSQICNWLEPLRPLGLRYEPTESMLATINTRAA